MVLFKMNKIAHLIFTMEVGGAENLLVDIANEQVKYADVSIVIVNNKYDKALASRISKNIRLIYIGRKEGKWDLGALLKIWRWLINYHPDVIHCHQHNLVNLLPFWRKKAVLTVHEVGVPTVNLKKYEMVFAISAAVQRAILNRGGIQSSVIHNGIAINRIRRKITSSYNASGFYKIVQVSRLHHKIKGQQLAIEAVHNLHENGYRNIQLFLIGDGPSMDYLKELTKELNLEENVFFLGAKERTWIYENLSDFDLLIQPSLYEGFGLTIIEGIAAGLPVIASNIDGPAEILKDMPAGFLFDLNKQFDLDNTIKKVIELTTQNKVQDLCASSYEVVKEKYSISQTANNYLKKYPSYFGNGAVQKVIPLFNKSTSL
jgi:glycosyltransferase involved in cell wall biosynthesis